MRGADKGKLIPVNYKCKNIILKISIGLTVVKWSKFNSRLIENVISNNHNFVFFDFQKKKKKYKHILWTKNIFKWIEYMTEIKYSRLISVWKNLKTIIIVFLLLNWNIKRIYVKLCSQSRVIRGNVTQNYNKDYKYITNIAGKINLWWSTN